MSAISSDFEAVCLSSPMVLGGEEKDQDSVRWFASRGVAAVGDGVTSSPDGGAAATRVTDMSPMLFDGDVRERLGAVSDLLTTHRLESLRRPLNLPASTHPGMRDKLAVVAQERRASAFQTTLVTAWFMATDQGVRIELIRCGDSAFFAFSEAGDLLSSSPCWGPSPVHLNSRSANGSTSFRFGPGDEILIKILGPASNLRGTEDARLLNLRNPNGWLICMPLAQVTE